MTELLQQVIAEIKKLPADQQDAIAPTILLCVCKAYLTIQLCRFITEWLVAVGEI